MAVNDTRLVGLELQINVAALKAAVDSIKTGVDAIHTVTNAWVLNDENSALPAESAVKTQLVAYDALNVALSKATNTISDSIAVVRAAV
jgi:hypothetical protein